jgi:hypothetical protein
MSDLEKLLADAVKSHHDLQDMREEMRVRIIRQCVYAAVVAGLGLYHGVVATEWVGQLASVVHWVACAVFLYTAVNVCLMYLRASILEARTSANIASFTQFLKFKRAIDESATRTDCRCSSGDVHRATQ